MTDQLYKVMACCPYCSAVMAATWNGEGTPVCEDCGAELTVTVTGIAEPSEEER